MDDNDQLKNGFIRQRRNLMIVSLVLLFSEVTNLTVEKINVFGTVVDLQKPQSVNLVLWVATFYWLWRYYQYARTKYKGALANAINDHMEKVIGAPKALKVLLRNEPTLLEPVKDVKAVPVITYGAFSTAANESNYLELLLSIVKNANDERSSFTKGMGDRRVRIDGTDLFFLRARAWGHLIVHTTLFSDVVVPYIVFAMPVLYKFHLWFSQCSFKYAG